MTDYTNAACRGYEYTFDDAIPANPHGRVSGLWERDAEARALTLCEGCPLREACLRDYWRDPWVVAGGTTARDRRARQAAA